MFKYFIKYEPGIINFCKLLTVIFFTALYSNLLYSQDQNRITNYLSISGQYGFITPVSHQSLKYYIQSRTRGINFYYGRSDSGKSWTNTFRYPDYGFGILFNKPDVDNILGNIITPYYRINIPFYPVTKLGIYYSAAIGTSIITNPFHPDKNH